MYKIIAIFFLLTSLISCAGNLNNEQVDQSYDYDQIAQQEALEEEVIEEIQAPEDFDVVESEEAAEEINQQIQEEIEEVEVSDRIFFELAQSNLTDDAKKILDTQAEWLQSDAAINVIIEGHCDERGTREYNIALGERRANSVKEYLISKSVSPSRIKTISYGKEKPAFVGAGEGIWSKNRRAVTVIEE